VSTLAARNADDAVLGRVLSVRLVGVYILESGVRRSVLCWCVWQESDFSRPEDVFTFNLLRKDISNFVLSVRLSKIMAALSRVNFQLAVVYSCQI
jgi:hypothetical protein